MDFIQELGNKKVLSKDDIVLLKEYISEKYLDYSKTQKSTILANAVHQVLDKNIHGLKEEYKQMIKQNVLKNTILKDGQEILLLDILNSCILMEDNTNEFSERLIDWVNLHVENKVSQVDFIKYYLKISTLNDNSSIASLSIPYVEDAVTEVKYYGKNDVTKEKISSLKDFILPIKLKFTADFRIILLVSSFFIISISVFHNNYKMDNGFKFEKVGKGNNLTILDDSVKRNKIFNTSIDNITENNLIIIAISNLPEYFKYKDINQIKLKSYLIEKKSLLVEEPYFSTIIAISKEYNLNPFVLFAITGQEQNFVPKQNDFAIEIANNPFNVYHSWKEYNTDIEDASRIVCNTIINLSKDRPQEAEPFQWINKQYAEDQNWSKGVSKIYNILEKNNDSKPDGHQIIVEQKGELLIPISD